MKEIYLYLTEANTDAGCSESNALRGKSTRGVGYLAKASHDFNSFWGRKNQRDFVSLRIVGSPEECGYEKQRR